MSSLGALESRDLSRVLSVWARPSNCLTASFPKCVDEERSAAERPQLDKQNTNNLKVLKEQFLLFWKTPKTRDLLLQPNPGLAFATKACE